MGEIDFVVLKINGVSVVGAKLSEDEAVQAFLKSNDPIQIEVQQLLSSSADADDSINSASLVLTLRSSFSAPDCNNRIAQTSEFRNYNIDDFIAERNDAAISAGIAADEPQCTVEEHVLFDHLAPEIDIEEVTLRKSTSNEQLGLSIIYSGADSGSKTNSGGSNNGGGSGSENNNDVCTEVYISHIEKDSVAGRDGRLRQGDQILQINGKDIKTKEETETLIAENNNAVTLLVSRYLYTDEDDFNDHSLEVDLEEQEVGDENDETDEEEGDELYIDNNSAYENCLTTNANTIHLVNNLDKVLVVQEKLRIGSETAEQPNAVHSKTDIEKSISVPKTSIDTCSDTNAFKIAADQKEQTSCNKSNQKEYNCTDLTTRSKMIDAQQQQQQHVKNTEFTKSKKCCNNFDFINAIESDTEHIYETIPEDSEPEPLYCSPYESSTYVNAVGTCSSSTSTAGGGAFHLQQRQKQRVAQWLGLCTTHNQSNTTLFPRRTIPMRNRNCAETKELILGRCTTTTNKNDTVRSIVTVTTNGSSSSGGGGGGVDAAGISNHQEEQDNSSSAYNTGGSNTSANQNRNEIVFVSKTLPEESLKTPLATRAMKRLSLSKDKEKLNAKSSGVGLQGLTAARTGCEELPFPDTLIRMYPPLSTTLSGDKKHSSKEPCPQICNKSSQLTQIDHFPRDVTMICPHFTAPNLRQYRFVSSQEVSALHPATLANENAKRVQPDPDQLKQQQQPSMVWKVKRRPDGTRYIVRRPAVVTTTAQDFSSRGRGLRNLESNRNDPTTTEDDTISEIKTGRYWSKEERKKHIERARERRLQQQQQQQHQFEQHMLVEGAMCISEKMAARLQQHRKNRQKHQMCKVQHQDLQFGGGGGGGGVGSVSQKFISQTKASIGKTCDLQTVLGIKQQPATTVMSNYLNKQQQQQQFMLSPNDDLAAAKAIPAAEEKVLSDNGSSP